MRNETTIVIRVLHEVPEHIINKGTYAASTKWSGLRDAIEKLVPGECIVIETPNKKEMTRAQAAVRNYPRRKTIPIPNGFRLRTASDPVDSKDGAYLLYVWCEKIE